MGRTTIGAARIAMAAIAGAAIITALSAAPGSAAASNAPIRIGIINDDTGAAASSYIDSMEGAQARIDAQNAAGGVDGRKLELVPEDAMSTAPGNSTAAHLLVSKGVFGIIEDNNVTFGATSYLHQEGIPVVGAAIDGPEWGQQPNTNMFAIADLYTSPFNGYNYTYTYFAAQLKDLGITKLAQIVFNAPAAISGANTDIAQAKAAGISNCLDALLPGDGNLNPAVLQIKNLGCNGIVVLSVLSTCITLATDLRQAGLKTKLFCDTSYDQSLLNQPSALAAMQGTYTYANLNVLSNVTPPVKLYLDRLKKYTSFSGGIPNENILFSYLSADLFIQGLKAAGNDRKAFISKMRQVSDYAAEGLLTTPLIFSHFGTVGMLAKKSCEPILEIKGKAFVPVANACGTLVRGAKA